MKLHHYMFSNTTRSDCQSALSRRVMSQDNNESAFRRQSGSDGSNFNISLRSHDSRHVASRQPTVINQWPACQYDMLVTVFTNCARGKAAARLPDLLCSDTTRRDQAGQARFIIIGSRRVIDDYPATRLCPIQIGSRRVESRRIASSRLASCRLDPSERSTRG